MVFVCNLSYLRVFCAEDEELWALEDDELERDVCCGWEEVWAGEELDEEEATLCSAVLEEGSELGSGVALVVAGVLGSGAGGVDNPGALELVGEVPQAQRSKAREAIRGMFFFI